MKNLTSVWVNRISIHNTCINQWLIIEKRCPMCMQCLVSQKSRDENLHLEEELPSERPVVAGGRLNIRESILNMHSQQNLRMNEQ